MPSEHQTDNSFPRTPEQCSFRTTHWSAVIEAADPSSGQSDAALATLCRAYWQPLYYYVRRVGKSAEDAKDLTQEFFVRLLQKEYLRAARQEKGRFRSFLLTAFKRFLANQHDHAQRMKRGGGIQIVSFDAEDTENRMLTEPADGESPDKAFERRWAMTLLEQVMARLQAEAAAAGNTELFLALKEMLAGDKTGAGYSELSARFGMTEGALRGALFRLRQRYRELLREEIANTVDSPEAVDDEIRHLFATFG